MKLQIDIRLVYEVEDDVTIDLIDLAERAVLDMIPGKMYCGGDLLMLCKKAEVLNATNNPDEGEGMK